uniref:Protein kinase domain-containing protein n=1 Tax=Peronospora matthiolae TaxID=2874970 RepID=A0AAV1VL32_9STRA
MGAKGPLSGTSTTSKTLPRPQPRDSTLVLYTLVGEPLEPLQASASDHAPDTNWNAFVLPLPSSGRCVTLADVHEAFPLGNNYHFAFRCKEGAYLDLTNPDSAVPFTGQKILARVTPLEEEPRVEYLLHDEYGAAGISSSSFDDAKTNSEALKRRTDSYASSGTLEHRSHGSDDYVEFESTTYESQDEESYPPVDRPPLRDQRQMEGRPHGEWNHNRYGQRDDRMYPSQDDGNGGSRFDCVEQQTMDEGSSTRQQTEWTDAAKDAQTYLRKQTEQAYDFAKKISIEDAKKGATATAEKAKKWGGSLLSSISATISNSSVSVTKQNAIVQIGGVSVRMVQLLAEGTNAHVYLVRSSATSDTFALKRVLCRSQDVEDNVQMELRVFRSVKHLNMMPLIEFSETRVQQGIEFHFLVPYFERGSLRDAITAACLSSSPLWPFTQRTALHLFHGICSGVLALHRAGFCHRDIRPHNILLSSSSTGENFLAYIPVVTHFGSCVPIHAEGHARRSLLERQSGVIRNSSAPYQAPESFEPAVDLALDGQSDVWSLGCVLYAMAFGTSPFEHPHEGFVKSACVNGQVSFPPEQGGMVHHRGTRFTAEFCDFIRDMLQVNPEERPSVLDALEFTEELLNDEMQQ